MTLVEARRWCRRLAVRAAWVVAWVFMVGLGSVGWSPARAESPVGSVTARPAAECRLVWGRAIADTTLSENVRLGGLSDLTAARGFGPGRWWAVTDRGPNGVVERDGEKLRTLLAPKFSPSLVLLRAAAGDTLKSEPGGGAAATELIAVEKVVPLAGPDGKPLTGLPTGGPGHLPVLSADGSTELSPDPDGVDTEGVVQLADGTLWIAEEYGPSLLKVGPDGRAIERHVPAGTGNTAALVPQRETLPAAYALRHDNRGFEALAATPDGKRLWVLLQSPLDNPTRKAAKKTGNVRLLGFDPVAGTPTAEHVYRLGDPTDPRYLTKGAPPDDGKLCAMAMLGDDGLLVLEQDDTGLARLYAVSLTGATDTLARPDSGSQGMTLEQIRDLPAAGIVPVAKRLVGDLTTLRETMAAQADGGRVRHGALKLEGLAVVDERHVLVANDDDFGVHGSGSERRRSFLWLVELGEALSGARSD